MYFRSKQITFTMMVTFFSVKDVRKSEAGGENKQKQPSCQNPSEQLLASLSLSLSKTSQWPFSGCAEKPMLTPPTLPKHRRVLIFLLLIYSMSSPNPTLTCVWRGGGVGWGSRVDATQHTMDHHKVNEDPESGHSWNKSVV